MPLGNEHLSGSDRQNRELAPPGRVRIRAFQIPVVRDAVVMGIGAPLSREVMAEILRVMTPEVFIGIDIRDDTVGSILVRETILRKIHWDSIHRIVRRDIKPLMTRSAVLAVDLEIEMVLGESFYDRSF